MRHVWAFIGKQQSRPTGLIGQLIGEQMAQQHEVETSWTLSLLAIQSTDTVLEIGFGAGKAIERITEQAPDTSIAGIDLSHTMVRAASQRNARAIKAGRVQLQPGDVMSLPYQDQQFNKIFSIQTFYFWPDHLRGIAEVFRVLKPHGTLIITFSTGKIDASEPTGLERYQTLLEDEILPGMQQMGFSSASLKEGPPSRQYNSVALFAVK